MLWKTKEVADQLGVKPRTILRWVHQFQVDHIKNEQGHYFFAEKSLQQFKQIKQQLEASLESDTLLPLDTTLVNTKESKSLDQTSEQRFEKIEALLAQKADDVVYVQILQQRTELEELYAHYQDLVERVNRLETILNQLSAEHFSSNLEPAVGDGLSRTSSKQHWLRKMFSL